MAIHYREKRMDFTLDEKTNAQVLKLRHFIKTELHPLEEKVEVKGELDANLASEIFEKSRTHFLMMMLMTMMTTTTMMMVHKKK